MRAGKTLVACALIMASCSHETSGDPSTAEDPVAVRVNLASGKRLEGQRLLLGVFEGHEREQVSLSAEATTRDGALWILNVSAGIDAVLARRIEVPILETAGPNGANVSLQDPTGRQVAVGGTVSIDLSPDPASDRIRVSGTVADGADRLDGTFVGEMSIECAYRSPEGPAGLVLDDELTSPFCSQFRWE